MKSKRKPKIGDIVYYHPNCHKKVRAAIITDVYPPGPPIGEETVDLQIFDNDCVHFVHGVHYGNFKERWEFVEDRK